MIQVKGSKKEYPGLSFEQVKELVSLMRSGKTEKEALELIKKWKILYYLS